MKRTILICTLIFANFIFGQTATAPSGSGAIGDPYLISSLNNLYWIAVQVNGDPSTDFRDKYFKQTVDIDASSTSTWFSGAGWVPIGHYDFDLSIFKPFIGVYDGNNKVVSGLYVNRPSETYCGLFGYIRSVVVVNTITFQSEIKNLGVINAYVSGLDETGVLAGMVRETNVSNCYSTGNVVSGSAYDLGGLIGWGYLCNIVNCYSTCSVSGNPTDAIGGVVGYLSDDGIINNCYGIGKLTGGTSIGGVLGMIGFTVESTISNCLWDTETSTETDGVGAIYDAGTITNVNGKTTSQMKTQSTFTDAGWDFTTTWARNDNYNGGYPYLQWQTFPYAVTLTNGSSFSTSPTPGQINQPIGRFALRTNSLGASLDGIWVKLNGTRTGASNFKLWESSDNSFNSSSDIQIGLTVPTDPGDGGDIRFLSLCKMLATTDKFYFLTCDLSAGASGSILPMLTGNKEMMLGLASLSGTITNSPLSSSSAPLPVELTSLTATSQNDYITLSWQTATETNNYGFEIEKAIISDETSNIIFSKIGFVEGHGNSNSIKEYSFIDNSVCEGTYSYRLKQIDKDGQYKYSEAIEIDVSSAPKDYSLKQNYPNPFNPSTTISFSIPKTEFVTLKIFDILGNEVADLVNQELQAGNYNKQWNPAVLASGIYFYRLQAGQFNQTHKMNYLK